MSTEGKKSAIIMAQVQVHLGQCTNQQLDRTDMRKRQFDPNAEGPSVSSIRNSFFFLMNERSVSSRNDVNDSARIDVLS